MISAVCVVQANEILLYIVISFRFESSHFLSVKKSQTTDKPNGWPVLTKVSEKTLISIKLTLLTHKPPYLGAVMIPVT